MNLLSVKTIKELMVKYHTRPSKTMGQNFLIDKTALRKVIEAADIQANDTIVEIGPGMGTLTLELAKKAKKVIAIEKDRAMAEMLQENLKSHPTIKIIQGDGLRYECNLKKYKVVANIPYYITSPIIRKFLEEKNQPEVIVLMVQKEVAQRITANPPHMSILAASVQFYAKAQIISYVSKGCFWPVPNVDSAIIKIVPHQNRPSLSANDFFTVVKAGFSHPRKQLVNNLSVSLKKNKKEVQAWLSKNNINPLQRAETLHVQDWINLTKSL